ncbi:hypothetical protein [Methanobacterium sp. BAmetb5]|uniref:hypothetical protein n=1 Tax=Methanobacterium sp. BAmetb5 TaxID=2025351 RepID=UPI000E8F4579|nr:hypothetical protein [Methanobacterium sp. BAmetb5]AXV40768.1 MAG: hypothetical protein CIT02_10830 [Methanobacterium sp. BAmetb5]
MESEMDEGISEKDVMGLMHVFTRVPPLVLKMVVKGNKNVVRSFEEQVRDHYQQLTEDERVKVEKVLEMPVFELQRILQNVYLETHQKQLKILADPSAEPFITLNLQELRKVLNSPQSLDRS